MAYYMMPVATFPLLRCVPLYIPVSSKCDQEASSRTSCSRETTSRKKKTVPDHIPSSSQSGNSICKCDTQISSRRFSGAMKPSKATKQSSESSWHRATHSPTPERPLIEPYSRDPRHAGGAKVYDAPVFDPSVLSLHYHSHSESLQHQFLQVTYRPNDEKSYGSPPRYAALNSNPFSGTPQKKP